jgi:lysophospholipase L1-like esterase
MCLRIRSSNVSAPDEQANDYKPKLGVKGQAGVNLASEILLVGFNQPVFYGILLRFPVLFVSMTVRLIKFLLYILFLLCLVIAVIEIAARQLPNWNEWINVIANPDHRIAPYSEPGVNGDGIRHDAEADEFLPEDFNVVFLGDSFTYGVRLGYWKTIPQRFEVMLKKKYPDRQINVANFGWIGSGPLLHYRQLKEIGAKYHPDLVIHLSTMNDPGDVLLYDALIHKKKFFSLGEYFPATVLLTRRAVQIIGWDALSMYMFGLPINHFFVVERPLEETRFAFERMNEVLDEIDQYSRDVLGAEYIFVIIPQYFQYNPEESPDNYMKTWHVLEGPYIHEPFRYFEEMAREVDWPVYSLLPVFRSTDVYPTVWEDDPHLNPKGAGLAARSIMEFCLQQGCFKKPGSSPQGATDQTSVRNSE